MPRRSRQISAVLRQAEGRTRTHRSSPASSKPTRSSPSSVCSNSRSGRRTGSSGSEAAASPFCSSRSVSSATGGARVARVVLRRQGRSVLGRLGALLGQIRRARLLQGRNPPAPAAAVIPQLDWGTAVLVRSADDDRLAPPSLSHVLPADALL